MSIINKSNEKCYEYYFTVQKQILHPIYRLEIKMHIGKIICVRMTGNFKIHTNVKVKIHLHLVKPRCKFTHMLINIHVCLRSHALKYIRQVYLHVCKLYTRVNLAHAKWT